MTGRNKPRTIRDLHQQRAHKSVPMQEVHCSTISTICCKATAIVIQKLCVAPCCPGRHVEQVVLRYCPICMSEEGWRVGVEPCNWPYALALSAMLLAAG
jgi:hypothetical protein